MFFGNYENKTNFIIFAFEIKKILYLFRPNVNSKVNFKSCLPKNSKQILIK